MNLLAHILLASTSLPNTAGQEFSASIMADYYRGNNISHFPQGIQTGFMHHKAIDQFTDTNSHYRQLKALISQYNPPHLTSGIIADIFYDYVLASRWNEYGFPLTKQSLQDYCETMYKEIMKAKEWHSPAFSKVLNFMYETSWLISYSTIEGIKATFQNLSLKMSGKPELESCIYILQEKEEEIHENFTLFWNEILVFSKNWYFTNKN